MTDEFHLLPIWLLNIQADVIAKNKFWWGLWNNPLLCVSAWNWGQFSFCPEHVPLCNAMVLVMLCWLLPAFSPTFVLLQILLQSESDVSLKWCNLLCCCQCEMYFYCFVAGEYGTPVISTAHLCSVMCNWVCSCNHFRMLFLLSLYYKTIFCVLPLSLWSMCLNVEIVGIAPLHFFLQGFNWNL